MFDLGLVACNLHTLVLLQATTCKMCNRETKIKCYQTDIVNQCNPHVIHMLYMHMCFSMLKHEYT